MSARPDSRVAVLIAWSGKILTFRHIPSSEDGIEKNLAAHELISSDLLFSRMFKASLSRYHNDRIPERGAPFSYSPGGGGTRGNVNNTHLTNYMYFLAKGDRYRALTRQHVVTTTSFNHNGSLCLCETHKSHGCTPLPRQTQNLSEKEVERHADSL